MNTHRIRWLVPVLWIPAFGLGQAQAACTDADRKDMRWGGMSDARITGICGEPESATPKPARSPKRPAPPPVQSRLCQTEATRCVLAESDAPGTNCWCITPSGPSSGVLVVR